MGAVDGNDDADDADDADDVAAADAEGDAVPVQRFWSCRLGLGCRTRRRNNGRSCCFALLIRAGLVSLLPLPSQTASRAAVAKDSIWNFR